MSFPKALTTPAPMARNGGGGFERCGGAPNGYAPAMNDSRRTDGEPDRDTAERDAAMDRSGLNPNVAALDPEPSSDRSGEPGESDETQAERAEATRVDPDSPGASVDDTTSPEAVEPNEPG